MLFRTCSYQFTKTGFFIGFCLAFLFTPSVNAALTVAQSPLFLTQAAKPIVMLNVSNDHQLYFKAFDDYSDLDDDGIPETTYKHSIDYYGYFDNNKCYSYSSSVFQPDSITTTKYCSGNRWSGNFLNWASMTRIDTIRKILYGGLRSTDSSSTTILERSYLPNDAHSFAKFYDGSDLTQLTPFSSSEVANGITLCNTTVNNGNALSQNVTDAPLIRVAKGNFLLWASNERWQCRWSGEKSNGNANNSSQSGISASSSSPSKSSDGLGSDDYIARIKVCASTSLIGNEECKAYGSTPTLKPIGILQTYGDDDKIRFGLMSGSYGKNKSGGVLRKNVGAMTDEINVTTNGTFKSAPSTGGIINTLNKFRIYGYRHQNGTYHGGGSGSDDCVWGINTFNNGRCSNWGNPQSEIFLESLRYLAGKNASSTFNTNDTSFLSGLTTATPVDPIASDQWCAPLNVIQFNASTSSYDGDDLSSVTDLGATGMDALTDAVGVGENIPGNAYFIGETASNTNQLCTAKTVSNLSEVRGTCPDAPRLSGSYHLAGLAHYAHTNSIRSDLQGDQLVTAYGISLSPAVPKITIPVPNSAGGTVTILPACKNSSVGGNCAIVDFKIVSQTDNGTTATGKLYVNWEDSEQGGDFDQDMWGVLDYSITSSTVTITTNAIAKSTGYEMGFGYIISGTSQDGFHVHSGINGFDHTDSDSTVIGCSNCQHGNASTTQTYTVASSTAASLEQPLYYASKWGGFIDSNSDGVPDIAAEWDADNDEQPDKYFVATDPKDLAVSLGKALSDILLASGSSASVASNSTRLDSNTVIYQAKFNSADWTGQLLAFEINSDGSVASSSTWDAGANVTTQGISNRSIFSYNPDLSGTKGITFAHGNLSTAHQALISADQVDYLRGDQSNEQPGGSLRKRVGSNWLLGDIINSDPWLIDTSNKRFYLLPGIEGSSYSTFIASTTLQARTEMIAVAANDGMLHVFDATVGNTNSGKELFAYVPSTIIPELAAITSPAYIKAAHKYLVDGAPIAGDAYFDASGNGNKEWRTVLVGTTAAGGKGIFALDVTFLDPSDSTYTTAETSFSSSRVLWEINDTAAPIATDLLDNSGTKRFGFADHLGLTMGQASIVRMANGDFAAVFGNGYNSANGVAVLYIVDIKTGEIIRSITTEVGGDNGLSTPITVDEDGDRIVDTIYAGDLKGNMWKFDVSHSNPSQWDVAFKTGSTPEPLYTAEDSNGVAQPITAKPQAGSHPNGGVMVYFGTGQYFETGDNNVSSSSQVQTFYGIRDNNSVVNSVVRGSTSTLTAQTIDEEGVVGGFDVRQTSLNPVDYTLVDGWYMDLLLTTPAGEAVVSQALLRNGRVIFVTIIPDDADCSFGGTSWLMEIDAITGGRLDETPFDITGDGHIDQNDMGTIADTNGDGTIDGSDGSYAMSGKKSKVGLSKKPSVISAGEIEYKYTSGSSTLTGTTSNIETTIESAPGASGRQSWIQLK